MAGNCGMEKIVFPIINLYRIADPMTYRMENMDKGLTLPKWVLIVWPKIPQMPQNLFVQFVFPIPKILDFNKNRLHWASVVHALHCHFNFKTIDH